MNKKTLKSYRIWKAMKGRCYSPSQNKGYYKADHIEVCPEWLNSYERFMQDMGPIPGDDYSIERLDVRGNYCPENCCWIRQRDQSINRRNTIFITYNGRTECLKEWSRIIGMNYDTLRSRVVRRGIPFEQAIASAK